MHAARSPRLTDADLSVLGPLAEHRILITPQIALLLGVSLDAAGRRMRRLRTAGLVSYGVIYAHRPPVASITAKGLGALGRPATVPPGFNPAEFRHDVGVGWLWLAARAGVFGRCDAILSEPAMIAGDRSGTAAERSLGGRPHGLGLGVFGHHGNPQRHYPDLLLSTHTGHRVALELELTAKSRHRMDRIMTAYATDPRIDLVVYLVPNAALAKTVAEAARRAGITEMVQVRRLAPNAIEGADAVQPRRQTGPTAPGRDHSLAGTGRARRPGAGFER